MAVADDVLLYPVVADLAYCLCQEYLAAGETLCFCGIEPSAGVPIDIGECGTECGAATVRLARVFPSTAFPQRVVAASCSTLLAMELYVTVYRCVPVGGDDGSNPTPAEYAAWSLQQYADMMAMRHAIACCFQGAHRDVSYQLGEYTPIPALGGVAGGQWRLLVEQVF